VSRRGTLVVLLATGGLLAAVVLGVWQVARSTDAARAPARDAPRAIETERVIAPPFVMFRTLAPHRAHGRVAMVPLGVRHDARYVAPLSCARVQYASGTGLCMVEEPQPAGVKNVVYTFDRNFVRGGRIELTGIPIRARISPDGRLAAVSVYAEEESPAGERLASETILIDVASGRVLADLREFAVDNASHPPIEGPVDIVSVTFQPDSDGFYATLSAGATRYLVRGSVERRRLEVQRLGLANEALSADGKRLLAKKQVGARGFWQLVVVDLATGAERPLRQGPRSVDDQVEWLDDAHAIYHEIVSEGTGLWMLSADGVTEPKLLISQGFSPSVERRVQW
jgi:hypothetical protein